MVSSRFWEYYAVRYFVGTVIGAIAIVAFNEYSMSPLKGQILPTLSSFKEAGAEHLVVLAALGLAYCYVASAPILAAHALRGQLDLASNKGLLTSLVPVAVAFVVLAGAGHLALSVPLWGAKFWAMVIVAFVLSFQVVLFMQALFSGFHRVSDYYSRLAEARAGASKTVGEYVESYRHLREHGNAFGIVLLEICLATACIAAPSVQWLSVLLVLWILPATGVWLIGTVLEARVSKVPTTP
ncbi:hypothetical protein [Ramlibacter sp.]|uniref:hypothetical protein n=1 Tax=Ramlibacter sp. TaxID=1917967 RepID=UPI003D14A8AE